MNESLQPVDGPPGTRLARAIMFARGRWKQAACAAVITGLIVVVGGLRDDCEDLPDFAAIADADERKIAFITHLLPIVEKANQEIDLLRTRLLAIDARMAAGEAPGRAERRFVRTVATRHGLEVTEVNRGLLAQVLRRVDKVPASLVIAQAAIESGWGTSRFAREGNNLFGVRNYSADSGLVPRKRAPGVRFTVAAYPSACEGVCAYIHNLNTDSRYRDLRGIRATLRTSGMPASGDRLALGLLSYSERGADYVEQVRSLIAYNELGRFDS